ncbi:MAG: OmpP1/FadL family transporter [Candidatus Omnitrophota bacterium]|nr:OmpP1/FadL family transporter [Candidatus Omnitrophota bacterium]
MFKCSAFAVIALSVLWGGNAFAAGSGSFRVETPDAGAMGKGSAFVGQANTPAAIYYNPAGLTQIRDTQVSVGSALIAPQVDYKNFAGDKTQMRRDTFFVPHAYLAVPINNKLSLGVGETSYFGLGTNWAQDSNLRYVATESVIENKDYMLTAAYQVTDQWSLAVSADNDHSKANKKKKLPQTGGTDGDFQLKARDNAWGYRLATMYKVNDRHQLGLMYRSRIKHIYEGKGYLNNLNSSGSNYQAIFGGTAYETTLTEKFTLPQSVVLGYSFKPTNKWTVNLDVEWMDWSSVKNEAVNWRDETDTTRLLVLNDGNPASRDWKSVWSQAVGAEYAANDRLRLRGGYYHHNTPIPQTTWDPRLPDSDSHGITTGLGYDLTPRLTLDLAYSALIYEHRKIDNDVGSSSGATVDGDYKQFTNIGLMTLTYKF